MITAIIGPMRAGKTSHLINALNREALADHSCALLIYGSEIHLHNKVTVHENIKVFSSLNDILDHREVPNYDVLGIDEIQFQEIPIETLELYAKNCKIIISGLLANHRREMYPKTARVLEIADNIIHLTAVCQICKKKSAAFSPRKIKEGPDRDTDSSFLSTCRECYFQRSWS